MSDRFNSADHERSRRAGQQAMAKQAAGQAAKLPREHKAHGGWRFVSGWLAFTQLAAFIVAIVHLFHSVTWDATAGIVGTLVMWPLILHPHWLSAFLAFAALLALSLVWGALSSRQQAGAPSQKRQGAPLCWNSGNYLLVARTSATAAAVTASSAIMRAV